MSRGYLFWSRVAVACVLACVSRQLRAGGTITDGAAVLSYPSTHWNGSAPAFFLGTDPGPYVYELSAMGWWYRRDADTREYPFPAPDSETYAAGKLTAIWNNVDGKGFAAKETTWVIDHEGPSGGILSTLELTNLTGNLVFFDLFHYLDADLEATPNDDVAVVPNKHYVEFTDGTSVLRYRGDFAYRYQVSNSNTLLLGLNDQTKTNLADSTVAGTPANLRAAFQFRYGLGPYLTVPAAQVGISSNTPRDHVRGDLFGVGTHSDLLFDDGSVWKMRRTARYLTADVGGPANPSQLLARDDFDGDTRDESFSLLDTGALFIDGSPLTEAPTPSSDWTLGSTGDFDADGKADILWRNQATGALLVWTMNGAQKKGELVPSAPQLPGPEWTVAGSADFNGDGNRDLLWHSTLSGQLAFWYLNAALVQIATAAANPAGLADTQWHPVAIGDYGKGAGGLYDTQDIVWQHDATKALSIWHMDHNGNRTHSVGVRLPVGTPDVIGPR